LIRKEHFNVLTGLKALLFESIELNRPERFAAEQTADPFETEF
jgi:hypothetical protein